METGADPEDVVNGQPVNAVRRRARDEGGDKRLGFKILITVKDLDGENCPGKWDAEEAAFLDLVPVGTQRLPGNVTRNDPDRRNPVHQQGGDPAFCRPLGADWRRRAHGVVRIVLLPTPRAARRGARARQGGHLENNATRRESRYQAESPIRETTVIAIVSYPSSSANTQELPPVTLNIIRATLQKTALARIRYVPEWFFQYRMRTQALASCGKCLQVGSATLK
jgi:hypothetical protein